MDRPDRSAPTPIAQILADLAKSPELTQDAREAIRAGTGHPNPPRPSQAHPACPCIDCMRAYGMVP